MKEKLHKTFLAITHMRFDVSMSTRKYANAQIRTSVFTTVLLGDTLARAEMLLGKEELCADKRLGTTHL